MRSTIFQVFALLILLISLWSLGDRLSKNEAERRMKPTASTIYRLDPKLLDLITLGHKRLIEYVGVINAIQFYTEPDLINKIPLEDLKSGVMQPVLSLKPRQETFYMLSCYIVGLGYKRGEECEPIMQIGLAAIPQGWRLAVTQGYIEKFILKNDAKAAVYFQLASTKTGAPAYLASLAARLAKSDPSIYTDPDFLKSFSELPDGDKLLETLQRSANTSKPEEKQ